MIGKRRMMGVIGSVISLVPAPWRAARRQRPESRAQPVIDPLWGAA